MVFKEEFIEQDGKILHKKTYDNSSLIEQVKDIRDMGLGQKGESKLIGRIPAWLVGEWIKEAGISWEDSHAINEVVRKKMLSGEFDKFRVWKGTY